MSYPFIPAYYQFGRRKGPPAGFVVHMAEGGGTVGYLSRPNPNHVSVHYVIEYGGRIVQMVQEADASGSINPREVRTTDDADGFFGATSAKAVLGSWWSDPNSALISLEIEGFARSGPNIAERAALHDLVVDVRSRHPNIGLLGHRDFADYKACPGKLIPWTTLGGHGPATPQEAPVLDYTHIDDQPDSGPGTVSVEIDNASAILADGNLYPLARGVQKHSYGLVRFKDGSWKGQLAYLIGADCGFLLKRAAAYEPIAVVDCDDAVAAELRAAAQRVLTRGV